MRRSLQLIQGRDRLPSASPEFAPGQLPPFEESLLTHLDSLYSFALRLSRGQRERAEDLLQDTCLRAFKNYTSVHSPDKIKAWFFRILVNTHINEFHRRSQEPAIVDVELSDALLGGASSPPISTPEEAFFARLLDGEIQQALDALPVDFRSVVWLADVEGFDYKEISEIVQRPMGTVASRIYRGHSLLREQLREYARQRGWMKE